MRRLVTAGGAGLLFGVGLVVSGMADPRNVIGFLDFTGAWNPALVGVMVGAIAVHAALLRLLPVGRRPAMSFSPRLSALDRPLLLGAAIFGVGWGLSGYCPGPAVVALGFAPGRAFAFVAALLVGSALAELGLSPRLERDCGSDLSLDGERG